MKKDLTGVLLFLLFALAFQIPSIRCQFGFPKVPDTFTPPKPPGGKDVPDAFTPPKPPGGKDVPDAFTPPKPPGGKDVPDVFTPPKPPGSGDKSPGSPGSKFGSNFPFSFEEMSAKFKFGAFMFPPDWVEGAALGKFIWNVLNLVLKKGLFFSNDQDRSSPPYDYQPPDKIFKGFNLSINNDGESYDTLLSLFENVIYLSPHRAHPWYFKRDSAGMDPYALLGDILAVMHWIDCSGEQAPFLLLFYYTMQRITIIQLRILIGYVHADGVMTASPHMSNIAAVQIALAAKIPTFGIKGFIGMMTRNAFAGKLEIQLPSILISEGNHDSLKILGVFGVIPEEFLVKVKMDEEGRMDPKDLEAQIKKEKKEGRMPFMVIASLGTTNLGAVDPIEAIAIIAEKYDLWFHIDGSHGGPCLYVQDFKDKWPGVERSNSFAFSFSSLLGVPYSSSYLITRDEGILMSIWSMEKMYSYFSTHASSQLWHNPKFTDSQKAFFMWCIKGNRGIRQHVEYAFRLTRYFRKQIKPRKNFQLLTSETDTPVVPFRVIPAWNKTTTKTGKDYVSEMDSFTRNLQIRLIAEGFIYITITRSRPNEPKHFIISLANSIVTEPDLDYVLDKIDCHAKNIEENKINICTQATWKRVGKASPLAASKDGYAPYVNTLMPDLHLPFFKGLFELIVNVNVGFSKNPSDASKNTSLAALNLGLNELGLKQSDIDPYIKEFTIFIKNTVTLGPSSFKMLDKTMVVSIMAELVTTTMAPSMESYESSPPFMKIKDELEKLVRTRVGYPDGKGDGTILPPDGVMDPLFTIRLAKNNRHHEEDKKNEKTTTGNQKPLVFYISTEAHYSWRKAASSIGLGLENCKYVKSDKNTGQMNLKALREAIEASLKANEEPFMVVGTLGTDVLGAVDRFDEIAKICTEFGLWFHVDCRNGGPTILSNKQRDKLKGIEKSDSFSFGPTKFYRSGTSDPFSILVTRKPTIIKELLEKNKKKEEGDDHDDSANLNTGRKSDEFKFWTRLKSEGMTETADHIERILKTTQNLIKQMRNPDDHRGTFKLILPEFELNSICFQYIPKKFKDETKGEVLDKVQIHLESILRKNKISSVYYTNATVFEDGKYGFLKLDVLDPDEAKLVKIITQIEKYGENLDMSEEVTKKGDEKEENFFSASSKTTKGSHVGGDDSETKSVKKSKTKVSEQEETVEETHTNGKKKSKKSSVKATVEDSGDNGDDGDAQPDEVKGKFPFSW